MIESTVVNSERNEHLIDVPFNGQVIPTVRTGDSIFVAVKPVCENIGIDANGQIQRIKKQSWSTTCMTHAVALDGKIREMFMVDRQTFVMWLATIDTSRIRDDLARRLIESYQSDAAKVLEDYFFSKSGQRQLPMTPHEEHMQQIELMQLAKGLIHPDFLEAKARIVLAREMHETPEIDHDAHPLYVQDYLKENGLSSKRIRSKSMTFGKLLKREYIARYDREQMKAPQMINGRMMDVYAYTERDRDLFDKVWRYMNLTLLIED